MAKSPFGNYKKIKRSLLKGGIVFAPRRYGKTLALLEIMHENPRAVVITINIEFKKLIDEAYFSKYGSKPVLLLPGNWGNARKLERVMTEERADWERLESCRDVDVYIDEWFWSKYRGPFKAAVTSAPLRIDVIAPTQAEKRYIKETVGKQYPHLREFGIYE